MNYKRTLYTSIVMWLIINLFTSSVKANNRADSIRMQMKYLSGDHLLQAHMNLCFLAAAEDNIDNELSTLGDFIDEASRQNNFEAEGLARSMQIMCYYNYHMADSLKNTLPQNLKFMQKHGLWNHYYDSWNTLIELYLYDSNLQAALLEAKKMYADAKKKNSGYGVGVSTYCLGYIYQTMQSFVEAKQWLKHSIATLSKEKDISLLLPVYKALGETLDQLGQYTELSNATVAWRAALDNYKREVNARGYNPSFNDRYLYCTLAAIVAEIGKEQYKKAAELLSEAKILAEGDNVTSRYNFLQVQTRYYAATKQYDKAIESNDENISNLVSVGDSVSLLTVRLQQAKLLLASGEYDEAVELYKETIPANDKLTNHELIAQLDEMRTIYRLDRLTLKNKIVTYRLYFFLISSALLLIVVILSVIYARRLRHKNRLLYNTYIKLQKKEKMIIRKASYCKFLI